MLMNNEENYSVCGILVTLLLRTSISDESQGNQKSSLHYLKHTLLNYHYQLRYSET